MLALELANLTAWVEAFLLSVDYALSSKWSLSYTSTLCIWSVSLFPTCTKNEKIKQQQRSQTQPRHPSFLTVDIHVTAIYQRGETPCQALDISYEMLAGLPKQGETNPGGDRTE